MRKILLFAALMGAVLPVAAQQQAPGKSKQNDNKKAETDLQRRLRVEGAAGGTAPVPKEEREAVGAGAKRHMHFAPLDRGMHRRSDAEVITPVR